MEKGATMAIIRGHNGRTWELEPGCYIDGHWGQYGNDRLAELAESYDIPIPGEYDTREIRRKGGDYWFDDYVMAGDWILDNLNLVTDEEHVWAWIDGELFLVDYDKDEVF
jgi:hypothetical protein